MYFRSPSDVAAKEVGEGVAFRLGGLVEKGSLQHGAGAQVHFRVTDGKAVVPADFNGVLPALFREGQAWSPPCDGRERHLHCQRSAGQA